MLKMTLNNNDDDDDYHNDDGDNDCDDWSYLLHFQCGGGFAPSANAFCPWIWIFNKWSHFKIWYILAKWFCFFETLTLNLTQCLSLYISVELLIIFDILSSSVSPSLEENIFKILSLILNSSRSFMAKQWFPQLLGPDNLWPKTNLLARLSPGMVSKEETCWAEASTAASTPFSSSHTWDETDTLLWYSFWIMYSAIFFLSSGDVSNLWLNFKNMFQGEKQKIYNSGLTSSVIWIEATVLHGISHPPPLPKGHYTFGMHMTNKGELKCTQSQKNKRGEGLSSKWIKALEPFVGSDGWRE